VLHLAPQRRIEESNDDGQRGGCEAESDERRDLEAGADERDRNAAGGDQPSPLGALDVVAGEPDQCR
jgi:hypothetical protein